MLWYLLNLSIILVFIILFLITRQTNKRWSKINDYLGMVTNTVNSVRYGNLSTKIEEISLTSDENKIIFSRDSFGAGLNIRDGMLDDLSKVEFTMLYGDVDKIIGDPLIIDVPEQSNEKVKIQNIKINDTISEEYAYNYELVSPTYDENLKETDDVEYQKKESYCEIDSYEDKVLNKKNNLFINGNSYYLKSSENVNDIKEEIESYFLKEDVKYELKKLQSGELKIK